MIEIECDSCYAAGSAPGTCERCIETGRHEIAGRVFRPHARVSRQTKGEMWLNRYQAIFLGPPHISAAPANASRQVVTQMGTLMLLKGVTAALGATVAMLQAA